MKLASGAELKINPAPFTDARALLTAFLEEAKGIDISSNGEMANVLKNVVCGAFASKPMMDALEACMARSLYRGQKIAPDTWEALENRQDYLEVCYLVAEENLKPFTKSLYAKFKDLLKKIEDIPA